MTQAPILFGFLESDDSGQPISPADQFFGVPGGAQINPSLERSDGGSFA
jgi:hypothetical protein